MRPQLPLLFLQQHVHDALEHTDTEMSVFFDSQCNFRRSPGLSRCRPLTGEGHLWESKIYIHFQPQKRASNKSNNLICRPDSARKRKMRKMPFRDFGSFQFQSRWQGIWDFWGFWRFQFTMPFTRWTAVLRFLRFSVSIALTRRLRFFWPKGTRDTIILLGGVPKQVATKVRPSSPRKLLEF